MSHSLLALAVSAQNEALQPYQNTRQVAVVCSRMFPTWKGKGLTPRVLLLPPALSLLSPAVTCYALSLPPALVSSASAEQACRVEYPLVAAALRYVAAEMTILSRDGRTYDSVLTVYSDPCSIQAAELTRCRAKPSFNGVGAISDSLTKSHPRREPSGAYSRLRHPHWRSTHHNFRCPKNQMVALYCSTRREAYHCKVVVKGETGSQRVQVYEGTGQAKDSASVRGAGRHPRKRLPEGHHRHSCGQRL